MRTIRYRKQSSSSGLILGAVAGAVAGLAAGILLAQRTGGIAGITARLRRERGAPSGPRRDYAGEDYEAAEFMNLGEEEEEYESLEERVLTAFNNDPILSERAIDIGEIRDGVIELAGWVDTEEEADRAVTIARGVPDVATVVNRLNVGSEEELYDDAARRVAEGDPALTEARWEGNRVGTGRRRQGTSSDMDRHADPRLPLEDRWSNEADAVRNAADEMEGIAERRRSGKKQPRGDRTGGAPVAPTGVPKGDHVAEPLRADQSQRDVGNLELHGEDQQLS